VTTPTTRWSARPTRLAAHGRERIDPWYWLRQRDNPEVVKYLRAENAHADAVLAHTRPLQERLFAEIKGRIKQTDVSVPYRIKRHLYYTRVEDGLQYPIHCRRRAAPPQGAEEILLDVNALARGHDYYAVNVRDVSPGEDILAFAEDTRGDRVHTIRFKQLATGTLLEDELPGASGYLAWANDNRTLLYATVQPTTLRSYRIYRHLLGTDSSDDVLVYEEADEQFSVGVSKTKSEAYLLIGSFQTVTSEFRYLAAADPAGAPQLLLARRHGHEYDVEHHAEHFYIRTNDAAQNFRLVRAPVDDPSRQRWEEVIPHRPDVLLEGIEVFRDYLVIQERQRGLTHITVHPWGGAAAHELTFDEPAYVAYLAENEELDTAVLRYRYTSLTTPPSVYDYDMATRQATLLKREEVLGDFAPERYRTERIYAPSADGVEVPISLVYRTDARRAGGNPLLLYGYGAYGISTDPLFSAARLSLLDRGFVYAIAHVRGGEDLGRPWYDGGRLLHKKNTFRDYIACAEHLVRTGYADPAHVFGTGGSAGGLLMGAVMNMRPDLFCGIIAHVPFVDVVTTMLDDTLPLTTGEYDEWGDPRRREYHDYILSYSPYDNVEPKAYPHLLVTAGLYDSQVQYWEPAKWVARLRATRTNEARLVLRTSMIAGHQGPSGRYRSYREIALDYAFLLDLVGAAG
jgi:oligopeptidase B